MFEFQVIPERIKETAFLFLDTLSCKDLTSFYFANVENNITQTQTHKISSFFLP